MGYTIRYAVLLLSIIAFIFALLGTVPLPYLVRKLNQTYMQNGEVVATLWSIYATKIQLGKDTTMAVPPTREIRNYRLHCDEERNRFKAMQIFAILGVVFGFYAILMSCLQCCCYLKVKLPLFFIFALSFLSEIILILIGISLYRNTGCKGKPDAFASFKDANYTFKTSFVMQILCCLTYLLCLVLTPYTQGLRHGKF
ncbi:unnamed protein product [Phytomonas sp. Hart1]|nr:unnamed protein product [Phytomonas sp. Hart1]|eukprot:CCW69217.1 unnamed protein product [Phytomonas sp. isolate Hart1]